MERLIKEIVQNTLANWDLTDYAAGIVEDVSPLRIRLNERLMLEPINIVLTSETPLLYPGDRVVMLRTSRGQKYIVLGKAVD